MDTFGTRLRDAMLAAGIDSPSELAKRCGVTRQIVNRWLRMTECRMSADNLLDLCATLKCRMLWLARAEQPAYVSTPHEEGRDRMFRLLAKLDLEQMEEWFEYGRTLVGEKIDP